MPASITWNPMQTTNSTSSFVLFSDGYVSGMFMDDPAIRYQLEGGVVSQSATVPLWGGLPISLAVPAVNGQFGQPTNLGATCTLAAATLSTQANGIHAWSVFNQAAAGIITPSSGVPTYGSGMSVNFMRAGTNARICLPLSSTLANTLVGGSPNQQVSWDFVNQTLIAYNAAVGALPIVIETVSVTSKIVVYTPATGAVAWNAAGSCAVVRI